MHEIFENMGRKMSYTLGVFHACPDDNCMTLTTVSRHITRFSQMIDKHML